MGVTITAINSKYEFDMGCGGFFNLRVNIAKELDRVSGDDAYYSFADCYAGYARCYTEFARKENDRLTNLAIDRRQLDKEYGDIIEFLFMPDVSGSISHGTCKKIYDLIKDVDFGSEGFRYGVLRHNDYEEFKAFLKDCYSHRKKMRWS